MTFTSPPGHAVTTRTDYMRGTIVVTCTCKATTGWEPWEHPGEVQVRLDGMHRVAS